MDQKRTIEIEENLKKVHAQINAHLGANQKIELICVSKNHPLTDILIANSLGEKNFGENRVQELRKKQLEFTSLPENIQAAHQINWHMIGTLQRNKVKDIVGHVALIHSVDSVKLLKKINQVSKDKNVLTDVLLQVNIAQEASKQGFEMTELAEVIQQASFFKNIKLRGLMVIAPFYEKEELFKVSQIFEKAAELLRQYQPIVGQDFNQLSMGMSNDYVYAIEAGATYLRIGTDIFGKRDYQL